MKLKKTLIILSIASFVSSANAMDLSKMVKIKEGHYASINKDGLVTEIATSNEVMSDFDMEINEKYHNYIKKNIVNNTLKNSSLETSFNGCGLNAIQSVSGGGPVVQNGVVTISGYASVSEVGPLDPLRPTFTFSRVKAAIKGFFADGSLAERNFQIDRDPNTNPAGNFITSIENNVILNGYSGASAAASIGLAGLDSYSWSIRSEFIIDKPTTDNTQGPEREVDCFHSFSARTFNTVNL